MCRKTRRREIRETHGGGMNKDSTDRKRKHLKYGAKIDQRPIHRSDYRRARNQVKKSDYKSHEAGG